MEERSEAGTSQLGKAVLDALHGALHIVGGMVQVAAGITRFLAITAIKAADAVEQAATAAEDEEGKPETRTKPR